MPEGLKRWPFAPQKRGARVRTNPDDWNPIVDVTHVAPGNRSIDRQGQYELYDGPVGVELKVEQAERSEPLLEAVADWEVGGAACPLFIWKSADGLFHMIYETTRVEATCHATSEDGYRWERREMGEVEFEGSTRNNMLAAGIHGATGVFLDEHAPPQERFKAMGGNMAWYDPETSEPLDPEEARRRFDAQEYEGEAYRGPKAVVWGMMLAWISADGLSWEQIEEPLADRPVNGGISARYDADNDEYIGYQQIMGHTAEHMPAIGTARIEEETQRRTIGFSRTKDFRRWPAPKLVLAPDAQDGLDVSFYGANYFPYPGRTDLHVMIVPVYHQLTDHVDTQIAFSRDGLSWMRPERKPIHTVGPPGSGEDCQVHTWRNGMVELQDGKWAVPHTGMSTLHNMLGERVDESSINRRPIQIHYALWEPHRFCGIEAESEGRFTIPTIYRRADQLRLNYRCAPGGWMSVELLRKMPRLFQPDLDPIEGYTFADCDRLTGDEADRIVSWSGNSDISGLGETVVIRVRLFQAKLFAYKV